MKKWIILITLLLLIPLISANRYFGQGYFGVGLFGVNTPPTIDDFQPSTLNFNIENVGTYTFNVTFHDVDTDAVTIEWTLNGTPETDNENLTLVIDTTRVYNVTANVSDNLSHTFVSWVASAIPISVPLPTTTTTTTTGGGGSGSGPLQSRLPEEQRKAISEELLAGVCLENATFINRLFSKCKIADNLVCEDGENFLIDSDCSFYEEAKTGKIFKQMWFLRMVMLFSIFLLARDSKRYPLIVISLVVLFVYNGAFINPTSPYDPLQCTDVNFIINAGYCVMPDRPIVGWIIVFAIIATLITYFIIDRKKKEELKKKKKGKAEPKEKKQTPETAIVVFILILILTYGWVTINQGIVVDNPLCMDVGYILNFGECLIPTNSNVGWLIGITIIVLILGYFFKQLRTASKANKRKPKSI